MREKITALVFEVIEEISRELPEEERLPKSLHTPLFGKAGKLDSLALVNLVVATEERIEEEFKLTVSLVDEQAISQAVSPFSTVGTFVDYIQVLLEKRKNG